jgi:hypothetical protein
VLNISGLRSAGRSSRPLWVALSLAVAGCGGEAPLVAPEGSQPPGDTLAPPVDTLTPPPSPPDSGTPPAPGPPPPPPPSPAPPPSGPPIHTGLAFGPSVYTKHESSFSAVPPSRISSTFNALKGDAYLPTFLDKLEAARRNNDRLLISFSGQSGAYTDSDGFNLSKWKQKVDEFRGLDLSSYIADGTLMGHYIMDEPSDARNWNGHRVSPADIDAMAKYSKEIWPDLPTVIRGWPWYLKGYHYEYLDAAWAGYHVRFGPIDEFITDNVQDAKASGLALVVSLNMLAGGGDEGLPGYFHDKYSMNASQVRAWGSALLAEPYICAFFMFRYDAPYFGRADIQAAVAELSEKAHALPNRSCRKS